MTLQTDIINDIVLLRNCSGDYYTIYRVAQAVLRGHNHGCNN